MLLHSAMLLMCVMLSAVTKGITTFVLVLKLSGIRILQTYFAVG